MNLKIVIIISLPLLFVIDNALCLNNVEVRELRKTFFKLENQLWDYFTKKLSAKSPPPQNYLYEKMHSFSTKIEKVQPKVRDKNGLIILPSFRKITSFIEKIDETFDVFNTIKNSNRSKRTINNLLEKQKNIQSVMRDFKKTTSRNYFINIKNETEKFYCVLDQSQKQILYNIYQTIAISQLKGYSIMQFTNFTSRDFKGSIKTMKRIDVDYKIHTRHLDRALLKVFKKSSSELWKCNPKAQKKDETYIEITELLQGYLINKEDLDHGDKCKEDCKKYTNTETTTCSQDKFCKNQRPCKGKIVNCKKIDTKMEMCVGRKKRIEYVQLMSTKRRLGKNRGCERGLKQAYSWTEFDWNKFSQNSCDFCFCLCDESGIHSDRYINLRPTFSNILANKVVTGVRFKKNNRIIHLQIQEGKLLPYGKIDETSVRWVPVDNYTISNGTVEGIDFHEFNYQARDFDLDTLKLNKDYVVTGVGFQVLRSHINLKIHVTPFNFKSGKLIDPQKQNKWKYNSITKRKLIKLINPDNPLRILKQSEPYNRINSYIRLRETDTDADASQTTVPFFDAQPVAPSVAAPLSGMGVFLKGGLNSGGFITPKIITYDYY